MSGAKDPDEFILKYGPERFQKLMDNSISYAEYKINRLMSSYNLNDTTEKIKFLTKMADILSRIDNNIERDIYVEKFSRQLGVGKEAILAEIEKKTLRNNIQRKKSNNKQNFLKQNSNNSDSSNINEDLIIYLLSKKDERIYNELSNNIDISTIKDDVKRNIIIKLNDLFESGNINNRAIDSVCETEEEYNILTKILMNENINEDTEKILSEVLKSYKLDFLKNKRNLLIKNLSSVSTNEERESIAVELNKVNNQLGQLMIR